jgi:hypothetical protein
MSRTVPVVALLLAFVALGVSGWLTLHPGTFTSASGQSFSDEERAQAKAKACKAYDVVSAGVFQNTNRKSPGAPDDISAGMVVVANAKVALFDGGQYVKARIEPATPDDLAAAMRRFGDALMYIGAAANAGVLDTDPAQTARFKDADGVNSQIKGLCV